ncbi:MAG: AsmA family protein [Ramlibacter sp.]|nr:AsmA family protein [Ramlibacter sp.]
MDGAAGTPPSHGRPLWAKFLAGLAVLAVLLALLVAFFPWDVLRGPLNRYVSEKTGRHFEITRHLDVKLGRTTRILADGIEFANPEWAADPHLVKAEGAQIDIELLPLLRRHIVLPRVELRQPQLGLQIEPDGRRSWALGRDSGDPRNIPDIGALVVDRGSVHYVATGHGADIRTDFVIDGPLSLAKTGTSTAVASAEMPLRFAARGTWQKEPFTAKGRTGNVMYLSAPLQSPFPLQVDATAGATTLSARGTIASLATLDGADAVFDLRGKNLADLYELVGVVLPSTPRYAIKGHVSKQGETWRVRDIDGKLGNTDMKGELAYDRAQKVPHLAGKLRSNWLDFDDLAPIIGLPEQPPKAAPARRVADAQTKDRPGARKARAPKDPNRKVLPRAPLDFARLKAMNSEVAYSAAKVTNSRWFPLERGSVNVRLREGVLNLEPMNLGIAGGTVAGSVRIDSHANPAIAKVDLKARSLELSKLFRDVNLTRTSFGKIHGDIELDGRGNSVAQMLAGSSGNIALLMGRGQISNLLLEVAGLDGAEIIKFLLRGDLNVPVRCAASAFDVKKGLMTSRALVLDTTDTVVYGDGTVDFATEKLDLYFRPYPKDMSILSLRSPLKLTGSLGAPQAGFEKGALAARAGLALALGAVNPLLALAATVETGPGEDANCGSILREAASPDAAARVDVLSRAQQKAAAELGGPPRRPLFGLGRKSPDAKPAVPASPAAPTSSTDGAHAPGAPDRPYGQ